MPEKFGCVTYENGVVWINPFNSHAALRMTPYEAWLLWRDLGKIPEVTLFDKGLDSPPPCGG